MVYEKQLLIEYQTKQDALQYRMDYMLNECATESEIAPLYNEWSRLQDVINQLTKELKGK